MSTTTEALEALRRLRDRAYHTGGLNQDLIDADTATIRAALEERERLQANE